MPILIKNESFNNIFLWKLCFIENNYFLCIVLTSSLFCAII